MELYTRLFLFSWFFHFLLILFFFLLSLISKCFILGNYSSFFFFRAILKRLCCICRDSTRWSSVCAARRRGDIRYVVYSNQFLRFLLHAMFSVYAAMKERGRWWRNCNILCFFISCFLASIFEEFNVPLW